MEVATAVLYLQATFDELEADDVQMSNVPSTWRSACSVCRRAASPSRSKRGWKTCTGVSATARPWAVWWVNYAPPWAKSKN